MNISRKVVGVLVLLGAGLCVAMPAARAAEPAKRTYDTCDLLTKKQVSKILGYKVVETLPTKIKATGVAECEYRTAKYWTAETKRLRAPYKLELTVYPLVRDTDVTFRALAANPKAVPVPDLGETAFYSDANELLVRTGDVILKANVTNIPWEGTDLESYVLGPERAVMDAVVPLFEETSARR